MIYLNGYEKKHIQFNVGSFNMSGHCVYPKAMRFNAERFAHGARASRWDDRNGSCKVFWKNNLAETATLSGAAKMSDGSFVRGFLSTELAPYKNFEGIESLTLSTFNGKLIEVESRYSVEYADFSDVEFKQRLSDILKVSLQDWKGDFLTCKDFQVYAKRPSLRILDYAFMLEAIKKIQNEKKIFVP